MAISKFRREVKQSLSHLLSSNINNSMRERRLETKKFGNKNPTIIYEARNIGLELTISTIESIAEAQDNARKNGRCLVTDTRRTKEHDSLGTTSIAVRERLAITVGHERSPEG